MTLVGKIVPNLPPANLPLSDADEFIIHQSDGLKRIAKSNIPFNVSAGTEITNTTLRGYFLDPSNWKDSYGNNADIGGQFNPSVDLSAQNAGDYWVDLPTGVEGEIKYIFRIFASGSSKIAIRTLYFS